MARFLTIKSEAFVLLEIRKETYQAVAVQREKQ
jgi:hypothetical protein